MAEIRAQRPQVLLTYDENGGYPHPDHIMTHVVSMAAVEAAADPTAHPELGEAWQVPKVYYHASFSRKRMAAVHDALTERGLESPFGAWLAEWDGEGGRTVTCRVESSAYFPQRDDALRAHATQIDPDGFFFAVPRDLEIGIWPWEEFELVSSTVPVAELEDDLFAGVRS